MGVEENRMVEEHFVGPFDNLWSTFKRELISRPLCKLFDHMTPCNSTA